MDTAPFYCPRCGASRSNGWEKIETTKKGFSAGKAVVGGVLLGPVGLLAGALGKKTETWMCRQCNYQQDYKP